MLPLVLNLRRNKNASGMTCKQNLCEIRTMNLATQMSMLINTVVANEDTFLYFVVGWHLQCGIMIKVLFIPSE
jgi:hypothetical protein